jgi:hypothetical protein
MHSKFNWTLQTLPILFGKQYTHVNTSLMMLLLLLLLYVTYTRRFSPPSIESTSEQFISALNRHADRFLLLPLRPAKSCERALFAFFRSP